MNSHSPTVRTPLAPLEALALCQERYTMTQGPLRPRREGANERSFL